MSKVIAIVMIVEMIVLGVVYAIQGDLKHSVYWLAGAAINIVVLNFN